MNNGRTRLDLYHRGQGCGVVIEKGLYFTFSRTDRRPHELDDEIHAGTIIASPERKNIEDIAQSRQSNGFSGVERALRDITLYVDEEQLLRYESRPMLRDGYPQDVKFASRFPNTYFWEINS